MTLPAPNSDFESPDPSARPDGARLAIPWAEAREWAAAKVCQLLRGQYWNRWDDIVQESMLKLLKNQDQARDWKAYLTTIVMNTARTILKKERRKNLEPLADSSNIPLADAPRPDERVESTEFSKVVERCLDELDEQFGDGTKAIVCLRNADIPWARISNAVRLSLGTCSDRHEKAHVWLARRLSAKGKEEGRAL